MPSPEKGRHRAPRQPLRTGAVAVPVVLLAAGGGAFAGLAGAPALTGRSPVRAAAAADLAPAVVALPRSTYAEDAGVLDRSAERQQAAQAAAQQRARAAAADRASRSRRAQLDAQSRAKAAAVKLAASKEAQAQAAARAALPRFVRPAGGPLTSPFGHRWGRLHAGMDFGAPYGSPVRAVEAGEVVESGFDAGGYGNFVHVQHSDGTVTSYNHMSRVLRRGGHVEAGDVLGLIGSTGHSTGPHLHFEVRIGGAPVDPVPWLRSHGISV